MKCPKCGYHRQTRDNAFTPATECPACGIIYAKHDFNNPEPVAFGAISRAHLKPSPVDAISLKKARERVEKRLRKHLEIQLKDQRHEETLKRARHFAEQAVRTRQENWKKKNGTEATDPPAVEINDQTEMPSDVNMETIILKSSDIVSNRPDDQPKEKPMKESGLTENEVRPYASITELAEKPREPVAAVPPQMTANRFGGQRMRQLHSVAWVILLSGIIGAALSWTTIGDVQAGGNLPVPDSLNSLPLGLLLGFAYLATGVLGFAFFWVSSLISRQLKEIRRLLLAGPMPVMALDEPGEIPQPASADG